MLAAQLVHMPEITVENAPEFHQRFLAFNLLLRATCLDEQSFKDWLTYQPTVKDIMDHVGLKCSVIYLTPKRWDDELIHLLMSSVRRIVSKCGSR